MFMNLRKSIGKAVGLIVFVLTLGFARINWSGTDAALEQDTENATTISERYDE